MRGFCLRYNMLVVNVLGVALFEQMSVLFQVIIFEFYRAWFQQISMSCCCRRWVHSSVMKCVPCRLRSDSKCVCWTLRIERVLLNVLLSEMYVEDVEHCKLHWSVLQWRTLGSSAFALRCTLSMLNVNCRAYSVSKILSIVHCRAPTRLWYFALVCEEMTYPRFVRLLYFAY